MADHLAFICTSDFLLKRHVSQDYILIASKAGENVHVT